MPVRFDPKTRKWCIGSKCVFTSKAKATSAYRAYMAKKAK